MFCWSLCLCLAEEKRRREFYESRGMAVVKPSQGNNTLITACKHGIFSIITCCANVISCTARLIAVFFSSFKNTSLEYKFHFDRPL